MAGHHCNDYKITANQGLIEAAKDYSMIFFNHIQNVMQTVSKDMKDLGKVDIY